MPRPSNLQLNENEVRELVNALAGTDECKIYDDADVELVDDGVWVEAHLYFSYEELAELGCRCD